MTRRSPAAGQTADRQRDLENALEGARGRFGCPGSPGGRRWEVGHVRAQAPVTGRASRARSRRPSAIGCSTSPGKPSASTATCSRSTRQPGAADRPGPGASPTSSIRARAAIVTRAREALASIRRRVPARLLRRDHLRATGQGAAPPGAGPAPARWPTSCCARRRAGTSRPRRSARRQRRRPAALERLRAAADAPSAAAVRGRGESVSSRTSDALRPGPCVTAARSRRGQRPEDLTTENCGGRTMAAAPKAIRAEPLPMAPRRRRHDAWWVEPLIVVVVLASFGIYATLGGACRTPTTTRRRTSRRSTRPASRPNCAHVTLPLVGSLVDPLAGVPDPRDPARLPGDLLLLPQGLLPLVLLVAAGLRRPGRAASATRGETRFPFVLQNIHRYFFWLSLVVLVFLWWDALLAFRFPTGFGIGLGTLILVANAALLSLYTLSCHSCRHLCGGYLDSFKKAPIRYRLWRVDQPAERAPRAVRLDQPVRRRADRPVRAPAGDGRDHRPEDRVLMAATTATRHTSTTSSSSAPAAPGCAPRSRRRPQGARTALVCKSLLGKAHTVMAEGGIAAALRQRLAGGQLAGPLPRHDARRQAAQQLAHGPDPRPGGARPRPRAGGVGRAVRPHQGRADPAARLRRPPLRPAGPRRRPDRPGDDPDPPAARRPQGHRRLHGVHDPAAAQGRRPGRAARSATGARAASSSSSRRRRSCSRPAASARSTRSPRTPGSTPATACRWRSTRAPT